jgi:2,5-furandicarboxylate decarboxylase 1
MQTMQQSLSEFAAAMDSAGSLVRIDDEVRVDQVPKLMGAYSTKALLIEKIEDTEFSVLANAYSNQEMFAWEAKPQPLRHSDPRHIEAGG